MQWVDLFDLFLFDFDGLLVNTEIVHYKAYRDTLAARGLHLSWSFRDFCKVAHLNATALKEALYRDFPTLDPNWEKVYQEKKEHYLRLVKQGGIELMPGVEKLLHLLAQKGKRRVIVTHSFREQLAEVAEQLPVLKTIPYWVTRQDYYHPKPHPEGYLKAISLYGEPGDRIIGFEDSIRGLEALQGTPALPVLICSLEHPLKGLSSALHFESLEEVQVPSS